MERELIERSVGRAPSVEHYSCLIFDTPQTAWNSLPDIIRSAESINTFKRLLKCFFFIFSLIPWPFILSCSMLYFFLVLICLTRPCNVSWHVTVRYKSSFIVIIIIIILRPRARRLPPDRHQHDTDDRWMTGARLMASWPKRDSASAHFGAKCQITIHTAVIYRKDGHKSFASISDSLCHDPVAIRTHMKPVLLELRQLHPQVTDVHFFS